MLLFLTFASKNVAVVCTLLEASGTKIDSKLCLALRVSSVVLD